MSRKRTPQGMASLRAFFVGVLLALLARPLRAAPNDAGPIVLEVQGDEAPERVRAALSGRLQTTLALSGETSETGETRPPRQARLLVRIHATVVTVTYRNETGREEERTVQAASRAGVLDAASILAENLVTDQTGALLAQTAAPPPTAESPKPPDDTQKKPATQPIGPRPWQPAVLSLVYPIASNFGKPNVRTQFALDALYGHVGEVEALHISGLVGQVEGSLTGAQLGGLVTTSGGDVKGLQLAGVMGVATQGVHGFQLAGVTAIAPGGVEGAQISLVSIAGDVSGFQMGLVNVARHVQGVQFGLVNVADDVDGVALGAFSYSRTERVAAIAWMSTHGIVNMGLRYITKHTYAVARGSYFHERNTEFLGPGVNVGVRLPVLQPFFLDIDFGTAFMFRVSENGASGFDDHQARLLAGAELWNHLSLFGGGGLDVQIERNGAKEVRFRPVFSAGVQVTY